MAPRVALAALFGLSAIALCAAACVPREPHVDCNFHSLSSPQWPLLASQSAQLSAVWKSVVAKTPEFPTGRFSGRGLVITATTLDLVNVPTILETLQSEGFNLPVEIWYSGEVSADVIATLSSTYRKLVIRNVANYASAKDLTSTVTSQGERVFQAKPLAIINSAFEEVLFLDADNVPLSNPAALFSSPEYLATGALFWPDFWQTASSNPIWSILEVAAQGWEQESGQMVVNKRRSWAALNLAFFLAKDATFQQLVNGDKEAFRLAFLATGTPFFMVETPVAAAGSETETGSFCGHTMVQHDVEGSPLFLHHNSIKHGADIKWQVMKSVAAGKSFSVVPLPPATINHEPVSCVDLTGADVIVTPVPFTTFEVAFSQRQAAAHPALKRVSRNEFTHAVQATMRKLLQGNITTVPANPDGSCPSDANYCYSTGGKYVAVSTLAPPPLGPPPLPQRCWPVFLLLWMEPVPIRISTNRATPRVVAVPLSAARVRSTSAGEPTAPIPSANPSKYPARQGRCRSPRCRPFSHQAAANKLQSSPLRTGN
ncbi:Hypothetical protein KFL_005030050 [Klebsormidium nitens]|uniref:Nucleotide-diphospho-sugar transferase n=1 Tax=Klebsormidium nitens TaxID=105231 RepID=A0A1Y1IF56_KLENI|nr:Hypothetical protein KFL_005030050 [Klebsormidium nitens]|eukprot:GAQ89253.1 Hypothetical protein KFL_005030050 [Klebsormidium nitens]